MTNLSPYRPAFIFSGMATAGAVADAVVSFPNMGTLLESLGTLQKNLAMCSYADRYLSKLIDDLATASSQGHDLQDVSRFKKLVADELSLIPNSIVHEATSATLNWQTSFHRFSPPSLVAKKLFMALQARRGNGDRPSFVRPLVEVEALLCTDWVRSRSRSPDEYAAWLHEIDQLASIDKKEFIHKFKKTTLARQIELLIEVLDAKLHITKRWSEYITWYCGHQNMRGNDHVDEHTLHLLRKLDFDGIARLQSLFPDAPNLELLFHRSLAIHYRQLAILDSVLVETIRKQINQDPAKLKEFLKGLHLQKATYVQHRCDEILDGILALDVMKTEQSIGKHGKNLDARTLNEQHAYGGTPYYFLSALVHHLNPQPDDVFYDLGSGYGKPSFVVGLLTDAMVKGIEMVRQRVAKSRSTSQRFGLKKVEYIEGYVDDDTIDFHDGTIFFLFNPFNRKTLLTVIDRLRTIARKRHEQGKGIRIVSYGDCTRAFELQRNWLRPVHHIGKVCIYESY